MDQYAGLTFDQDNALWPVYISFVIEIEETSAFLVPRFLRDILDLIRSGFTDQHGNEIDQETCASIARLIIVFESIRQQLCTGVGLKCPYGDEGECCGVFRRLFERTYQLTKSGKSLSRKYWLPPPCLY